MAVQCRLKGTGPSSKLRVGGDAAECDLGRAARGVEGDELAAKAMCNTNGWAQPLGCVRLGGGAEVEELDAAAKGAGAQHARQVGRPAHGEALGASAGEEVKGLGATRALDAGESVGRLPCLQVPQECVVVLARRHQQVGICR